MEDNQKNIENFKKDLYRLAMNANALTRFYAIGTKKYNWDIDKIRSYIFGLKDIHKASPEELYCITKVYSIVCEVNNYPSRFFSSTEIRNFESENIDLNKIYPIEIDALKTHNEFVCTITFEDLHKLYDNGFFVITLRNKRLGKQEIKTELFTIPSRKNKVYNEKQDSFESVFYSLNSIVLNIDPQELECYYYDEAKKEILFKKQTHLDILDGKTRIISALLDNSTGWANKKMQISIVNLSKKDGLLYIAKKTNNKRLLSELYHQS